MVSAAEPHPRTLFVVAGAERIPLRDETADLATVAAAFHWFDQPRAFAELARVLRGGAGLIVYSDFFLGRLAGRPDFADWFKGVYLPRYPTPVRHAHFDPDAARAAGFDTVIEAEGETSIALTRRELADFLLSQSNAAIAIESGTIDADDLHAAVVNDLAPFFADDSPMPVAFGLKVWMTTFIGQSSEASGRRTPVSSA
jgi:SAM-dependent methyltransferase